TDVRRGKPGGNEGRGNDDEPGRDGEEAGERVLVVQVEVEPLRPGGGIEGGEITSAPTYPHQSAHGKHRRHLPIIVLVTILAAATFALQPLPRWAVARTRVAVVSSRRHHRVVGPARVGRLVL